MDIYVKMNKKDLTETDIRTKFITPAILKAGWDKDKQLREEKAYTDGRILVQGKTYRRGKVKKTDYILYHKSNLPLAVVEAKDNKHSMGEGMQQALDYAEDLDILFSFSSNGDGFIFHDKTTGEEKEISLNEFPSHQELWNKYKQFKNIDEEIESLITTEYYYEQGFKQPRYYQINAINRVIESIAKGNKRNLLVMATGTGKTYVAFQILWRLWKAKKLKGFYIWQIGMY